VEYSKSDKNVIELINYAKTIDLSEIQLFKALGGEDDGIVDLEEFRQALHKNPKLYPFGSKLNEIEIRNMFTRICCSEFDSEIS